MTAQISNRKKNKKRGRNLHEHFAAMTNAGRRTIISLTVFFAVALLLRNIVFALIGCALYAYFDWYANSKKAAQKAALIDKQVLEALAVIKNAVQSGQSLAQSIGTAGGELKEPLKSEFEKMSESLAFGVNFDKVLLDASGNSPSKEFRLMADTIRISKDTGASLSDIFDRIIDSTSQRIAIQAKVEALTSQGRMSGNIVSVTPFFVILIMYAIEPEMMRSLFTTLAGNILLLLVVVMVLAGSFVIRKLTEIKF
jgi:tight adherence protein B